MVIVMAKSDALSSTVELSNIDREWIRSALETQKAVFRRRANAERNEQIKGLLLDDLRALDLLIVKLS